MREYKGMGGSRVSVSEDGKLFVKQLFLSEEFSIADIIQLRFKEPRLLLNGHIGIRTNEFMHEIVFTKKQANEFRELYAFLLERTSSTENATGNVQPSASPIFVTSGNPEVDAAIKESLGLLSKLESLRDSIKNQNIKSYAAKMIEISHSVIDKLAKNPRLFSSVKRFFSYYLPTTLKLVTNYAYMETQKIKGENISKTMQRIENTLEKLQTAYCQQLDKLFAHTALDLETDIHVMEQMLKRDGLTQSSFQPNPEDADLTELALDLDTDLEEIEKTLSQDESI